MKVFVERVTLGTVNIDIYAAAKEGAPASAHYLLYDRGECLNVTEPFWRLPSPEQIAAFRRGQGVPPPRTPWPRRRATRPEHRRAHTSLDG